MSEKTESKLPQVSSETTQQKNTTHSPTAGLQHMKYLEEEPNVGQVIKEIVPSRNAAFHHLKGLFPFIQWMPRYNLQWLLGDGIAGLTVGLVVVPQAMAYALLAGLSPDFGLYTSFAGAATYWLFGTSKDIVIGVSTMEIVHTKH